MKPFIRLWSVFPQSVHRDSCRCVIRRAKMNWNKEFMKAQLQVSQLSNIKMLILDVDGVLTDCRVYMDSNGDWKRHFSIRDGYGIQRLMEAGYKTAVITGSKAKDIAARVQGLGIHYFFEGSLDKLPAFLKLQAETGLKANEIAYMGDDLFDIPVLEKVGFSATVPDAMEEVIEIVDYVAKRPAGNGAVREVCDFIIKYGAFRTTEKEF